MHYGSYTVEANSALGKKNENRKCNHRFVIIRFHLYTGKLLEFQANLLQANR